MQYRVKIITSGSDHAGNLKSRITNLLELDNMVPILGFRVLDFLPNTRASSLDGAGSL